MADKQFILVNPQESRYAPRKTQEEWDAYKQRLSEWHHEGISRAGMLARLRAVGFQVSIGQLNSVMKRWGLIASEKYTTSGDPNQPTIVVASNEGEQGASRIGSSVDHELIAASGYTNALESISEEAVDRPEPDGIVNKTEDVDSSHTTLLDSGGHEVQRGCPAMKESAVEDIPRPSLSHPGLARDNTIQQKSTRLSAVQATNMRLPRLSCNCEDFFRGSGPFEFAATIYQLFSDENDYDVGTLGHALGLIRMYACLRTKSATADTVQACLYTVLESCAQLITRDGLGNRAAYVIGCELAAFMDRHRVMFPSRRKEISKMKVLFSRYAARYPSGDSIADFLVEIGDSQQLELGNSAVPYEQIQELRRSSHCDILEHIAECRDQLGHVPFDTTFAAERIDGLGEEEEALRYNRTLLRRASKLSSTLDSACAVGRPEKLRALSDGIGLLVSIQGSECLIVSEWQLRIDEERKIFQDRLLQACWICDLDQPSTFGTQGLHLGSCWYREAWEALLLPIGAFDETHIQPPLSNWRRPRFFRRGLQKEMTPGTGDAPSVYTSSTGSSFRHFRKFADRLNPNMSRISLHSTSTGHMSIDSWKLEKTLDINEGMVEADFTEKEYQMQDEHAFDHMHGIEEYFDVVSIANQLFRVDSLTAQLSSHTTA